MRNLRQPDLSEWLLTLDAPRSRDGRRYHPISSDFIKDETGWDVVYCDGACKRNGKVLEVNEEFTERILLLSSF